MRYERVCWEAPKIPLSCNCRSGLWYKRARIYIVCQIVNQVCIWIVGDHNPSSTEDGSHKTRKSSPSAKFQDRLAMD